MDKENSSVRAYLAKRADLVGAIRLPNNAFKSNAGAKVTSDIIVLQKRAEQTKGNRLPLVCSARFSEQTLDGFIIMQIAQDVKHLWKINASFVSERFRTCAAGR